MKRTEAQEPRRLLLILPNWVGDVVMATPVLAALRTRLPGTHIAFLHRPYVEEVFAGGGWHDEALTWPTGGGFRREARQFALASRLRAARFDAALLLTNSLRSALLTWWAGIPRRIGYARDGRRPLLTDRLPVLRSEGEYTPTPLVPYYGRLAEVLGVPLEDRRLRLAVTPGQEQAGQALQRHYGLQPGQYAVLNPGAAFGSAKCWLPERYAAVADELYGSHRLRCIVTGAPGEAPLMQAIAAHAKRELTCALQPGTTLGSLKVLIRDAALLVCNDTGPRHYGNAFGVPTVTIFGPTHQAWTDTDYADELKLQAPVPCGPCQLRQCPLDLQCMHEVTVAQALDAAQTLLDRRRRAILAEVPDAPAERFLA